MWRHTRRWRLGSAEHMSNQSQNGLQGEQHALPPAAQGHRMHQSCGTEKKKCCYFKAEPPPPHPVSGRAHIRFMGQFAQCSISLLSRGDVLWEVFYSGNFRVTGVRLGWSLFRCGKRNRLRLQDHGTDANVSSLALCNLRPYTHKYNTNLMQHLHLRYVYIICILVWSHYC